MAAAPHLVDPQDDPAGGVCGELNAGLDRLDADLDALARAEGVTARHLGAVMHELTRLVNRTHALHDKGAAIADQIDVASRTGARSTGQWLARVTNSDPRAAHRQASRAAAAGLGVPSASREEPGLELVGPDDGRTGGDGSDGDGAGGDGARGQTITPTGRAQLAGEISREHVEVIQHTMAALPSTVTEEARAGCEAELVALAVGHSPRDLRQLARRVLERVGTAEEQVDAHEHDQVAAQEERAWERSSFWVRDNGDGTMHGQFTVPTLAGQALKTILDAMSSPRRAGTGGRDVGQAGSTVPRELPAWLDTSLDPRTRQLARQQRQGQDLATLLTHLPTDHLHDKTAATVLVTTRLSDLQDVTGRVGSTADGEPLTAGQVRQIACQAGVVPVVLGSESQPLDLGRQARFFTAVQRAALALTYTTCAADGCDIPFGWTETHHLQPWTAGGRTDLANAVPLCGHHHRALDRGYEHTVRRAGRQVVIELARRRT